MAKSKKEKEEIKNEQVLETPSPETTETPKIDEGQPIMPADFTLPKDENGNIIAEDAGDTSGLLKGEEGAEGKTDADVNNEGDGKETPATPEGEENAKSLEENGEKVPETPETPEGEDKGEEVIAKAQTVLDGEGKIQEALKNNDQETAAELLKNELEKAAEVKAELEADIEKRENEIKKKSADKKKFQRMFGGFWNGVSSGWED